MAPPKAAAKPAEKSASALVAERRTAQHCAELVRTSPAPEALIGELERLGQRLIRTLPAALAPMLGGAEPTLGTDPVRTLPSSELIAEIGPLAANSLLACGADGATLLASIEPGAILRLVDRAFGGKGEAPAQLPPQFPLSSELMIVRLETLVLQQLVAALGDDTIQPLRRNPELVELLPYPPEAPLACLRIAVMEGMRAPWHLTLALPLPTLSALFGSPAPTRSSAPKPPRAADPAAAPFAELTLPLRAVLVEMRLPLATVSALEPGTVLPVAVARAVPLAIGEHIIARGTIGAQDDRVAVKLTHIA